MYVIKVISFMSHINYIYIDLIFSHHQKTIICDAAHPEDDSKRRLVAYLGGLDVTQGRYDTPAHPLFSTLNTFHNKDFYQCCIEANVESGPRQPWHDIHCKVCVHVYTHVQVI